MKAKTYNTCFQFNSSAVLQRFYLGLGILLSVILVACGESKSTDNKAAEDENAIPVSVQSVQKENIIRTLDYTATLNAFTEIHAAPASPGRISKINVEVGSRIKKGQVLVQMDRTQLTQARSQLENARYNFEQIDTLFSLQSISEQQYEQAKTQYEVAKANVDFLKENTTLLSPINGIVTAKYYEDGEIYSGAPNTEVGKAAILTLMQINPLKAMVNISQSHFPELKKGMVAKVHTDIYPEQVFDGSVYKIYPTINAATRTFPTEVLVKNNNEILRPGMFSTIKIELHPEDILVVPAIAVLKQEGTSKRFIFVNQNGTAKQIQVKLGKRINDKIEVIADEIKEGMEIIVEGQANLLNGSKLKIVK
ncbi:RND family efflux transporter, MFP subunit [Saccharicrinis carchari]|uniref:RND family efflux transporter, MFP subunit n=1 Tax=Saccharicrinis carchari TaxID=1168039 RepID=A0A521B296_SACCC|nr:efflux RND transporter periplasmic adaptor subunit [Saccharicrinis carchari]SMO41222.1 RND family efflux transporter, MFP subunit [Saccharicrinis carchari]